MDAGPLRDILTAGLGVATGAMSGAFGVGGAVISTPGIRALGVPALVAVGTTLPSILPSAVSGALRYQRERLIDWPAVKLTLPIGFVASVIGALLSEVMPGDGHLLMLFTAALLAFTAYRMYASAQRSKKQALEELDEGPAPDKRTPVNLGIVGAIAGLLSGMLGIGGGVVMVPGFHSIAGLSIKSSIATSLVCVAGFALPGTITHAALGNIDWRVAAALTLTVVPGARLGSHLTVKSDDVRLRYAVAIFLAIVSVIYGASEVVAWA